MDLKVIYLPEAYEFMLNINSAASEKLAYNVRKVRMGIKDKNIFKKITGTEIWEFRALTRRQLLQAFVFLGHPQRNADSCHAWDREKIAENTKKGNCQGGGLAERIF